MLKNLIVVVRQPNSQNSSVASSGYYLYVTCLFWRKMDIRKWWEYIWNILSYVHFGQRNLLSVLPINSCYELGDSKDFSSSLSSCLGLRKTSRTKVCSISFGYHFRLGQVKWILWWKPHAFGRLKWKSYWPGDPGFGCTIPYLCVRLFWLL